MTEAQLFTYWFIGLGIAAVVVLAVVGLLYWIYALTRSIRANATRALRAAEQIRANTQPIWNLQETNMVAAQILEATRSIRAHADAVADTLEHHDADALIAERR